MVQRRKSNKTALFGFGKGVKVKNVTDRRNVLRELRKDRYAEPDSFISTYELADLKWQPPAVGDKFYKVLIDEKKRITKDREEGVVIYGEYVNYNDTIEIDNIDIGRRFPRWLQSKIKPDLV